MTGFEPQTSDVGSDRSTNKATTTGNLSRKGNPLKIKILRKSRSL